LAVLDEPLGELARLVHSVELERDRAVPVEAQPEQRPLDLLGRLRHLATRVRVFDPQQAFTAALPREQPVEEEGPDTADVEEAGGARGHANADAHLASIVGVLWNSARMSRPAAASTR